MTSLAAKTDSFAAADLKRLASRMAHHAAARGLAQQAADNGTSHGAIELDQVEASEEDVGIAMEGLAPASLQGVKLTSVEVQPKLGRMWVVYLCPQDLDRDVRDASQVS